jgi:L-arabinose transport system substrate-binding protein
MRTTTRYLATVAVLLALAGCRSQQAEAPAGQNAPRAAANGPGAERLKIGFLVKMPDEKWFQDEWKFAQKCADRYQFDLLKIGATDGEKVLSAIDSLAASGAKGFVICTPDVKLGPAILAKAKAQNMKVFTVDDQFVGPDGKFLDTPYMGISARDIGAQVGQALAAEFKKRGWKPDETGACGVTFTELNTARERTDGTIAALKAAGFPAQNLFTAPEKTTDVPGAMAATDVLLTQHPNFKRWLVFSMNDEGVLGAVRSLENRGFTSDSVLGIGIGGSSSFAEMEKQPPTGFYGTCLISPLRHGYETTEYLYRWIKDGTEPPKDTRTRGTLVTRENFKQVAREQGLLE